MEKVYIINDKLKKELLLNSNDNLRDYKLISKNELVNKFSYNNESIFFLMKKYKYNYNLSKEIISILPYINENNAKTSKLIKLYNIKKELDYKYPRSNLFTEYLKDKEIYFYHFNNDKNITSLLNNDIKVLGYNKIETEFKVYNFISPRLEVMGVFEEISKLLNNQIDINNIKLIYDDRYNDLVNLYSKYYNLKLNETYSLSGSEVINKFLSKLKEGDIDKALDVIYDEEIKLKLINLINSNIEALNFSFDIFYEVINEEIKSLSNKYLYTNSLEEVDFNYENSNSYVFILGFDNLTYPKKFLEKGLLSEEEKDYLGLNNLVDDRNNYIYNFNKLINSVKKVYFTYSLTGDNSLSTLLNDYDIPEENYLLSDNLYSKDIHNLSYALDLEKLSKYKEKGIYSSRYYSTLDKKYNTYNNNYNGKFKPENISLSYSSLNTYKLNPYAYYLENILKIRNINTSFNTSVGTIIHSIMEKVGTNNSFEEIYNSVLEEHNLDYKERFILDNIKDEIEYDFNFVKKHEKEMSFDKILREEYIDFKIGDNSVFKGFIDKILIKDDTFFIIDYKLRDITASVNLDNIEFGLNMQLPIYIYLISKKYPNLNFGGIYLNYLLSDKKDIDFKEVKDKSLKLQGYTSNLIDRINLIENEEQEYLANVKYNKNGEFTKSSKLLNDDAVNEIKIRAEEEINNVYKDIMDGKFPIRKSTLGGKVLNSYIDYFDVTYINKSNSYNIDGVN